MPQSDDLYFSEKGIAFNGTHLFSIGAKPLPPASITTPVRLYLLEGFVRCADGVHAVHRYRQEKVALARDGVPPRDLPSQFGYVTNEGGEVTHWFAPSGLLFTLTYLGKRGEEAATTPFRMPSSV